MLTKMSNCQKFFLNLADCQKKKKKKRKEKKQPLCPPDYHIFHKVWLELDENGETVAFWKKLTAESLQSAPNDPELN